MKNYDKVLVEPIVVWLDPGSEYQAISPDELKELTDYFHASIVRALGDAYPVVEQPGPGVLRLRIALTGITAQKPDPGIWSNTPETYVQAKLRQSFSTRYSIFEASVEVEALDSMTSERVGAYLDRRVGQPERLEPGDAAWQQILAVLDYWADRFRRALDNSRT